jgi:DNA-binding HxlR family transcriptional regulator
MTNTPVTCPVEAAMRVLGGKWKPLILFYLMDGAKRFGELRRLMPHVTQQMLTLQLRELEQDGIIHREVYKQVPPKVEYWLTPLGQQLEPILKQMLDWGVEYMQANGIEAVPPAELAAKAGG